MKRYLSMLLACLMLLTLLIGCASEPAPSTSTDAPTDTQAPVEAPADEPAEDPAEEPADAPTETPAEEPVDTAPTATGEVVIENGVILGATYENTMVTLPFAETLEISYWRPFDAAMEQYIQTNDENYYFASIEEKYNIDFVWTHPTSAGVGEQFALMLTAEDYTDVISQFTGYYTRGVDHAIEEGIIWPLEDFKDYYPNFEAIRTSSEQLMRNTVSDNGHMYAMFNVYDSRQGAWWGPYIRGDLLEKYNLDMPVTYADWEEALTIFKDNEERMANGPLLLAASGMSWNNGIQAGYNFGDRYTFNNKNGTVVFSAMEPGYKDYLTLMADWWQKGLIYRDFLSNIYVDAANKGEAAIWEMAYDPTLVQATFDSYGEGWTAVPIPQPKVNADDEIHFMTASQGVNIVQSDVITTAADEEKVKNIVAVLDQAYTVDGVFFASYGTEGYTFEYDDNGEIVFTELITDNPEGMTFILCQARYLGGRNMAGVYNWARELDDVSIKCMEAWSQNNDDWVFPSAANMTVEESEEFAAIMSDIQTYIEENIAFFITGDKPMSEFDSFIDTIKSMGIDDAIAIKQASLDRYLAR